MTDEAMSPLRRRMIEDMTIRKFAPKTQHDYVQRVKNFAAFLGRSPDTASFEDVRRYRLHLAESSVGVPTINQTVSTLRFLRSRSGTPRSSSIRMPFMSRASCIAAQLRHPSARAESRCSRRPGVARSREP
jgi:integrase-like protein